MESIPSGFDSHALHFVSFYFHLSTCSALDCYFRTVKAFIHIIDWEYPEKKEDWKPYPYDLEKQSDLMELYMGMANGTIIEMRAEADSDKTLEVLRQMVLKVGSCKKRELKAEEKAKVWLFQEGDECYVQADESFYFICPTLKEKE